MKVLVISAYADDAYVRGAMAAGVAGYILKEDAVESVVQAIHIVMRGGTWLSRGVMAKLAEQTVSNYISRLHTKLEVRTCAEAIVWAREHGFGQLR